MPETPVGQQWVTLPEALALAGDGEAQLRAALLAGDVKLRFRNPNGTTFPTPPDWLARAIVDWANSRIDATRPPWFGGPVEVDKRTLLDHFGAAKPTRKVGGRKPSIPPEALIKVGAWLAANGIPAKLADVEDKLREVISVAGADEPAESTVRTWAGRIVDEHRAALK
jgi:hypothetical protein